MKPDYDWNKMKTVFSSNFIRIGYVFQLCENGPCIKLIPFKDYEKIRGKELFLYACDNENRKEICDSKYSFELGSRKRSFHLDSLVFMPNQFKILGILKPNNPDTKGFSCYTEERQGYPFLVLNPKCLENRMNEIQRQEYESGMFDQFFPEESHV